MVRLGTPLSHNCGRAKASPQTNLEVGGQRHFLIPDLKENVGTFLAFLCSSNWNEWYVSKWRSKGPGVESKVRGHWSREFHVDSTGFSEAHVTFGVYSRYQQRKHANNSRSSIIVQLSVKFEVLTGKSLAWSDTLTGHFC